MRIISSIRSLLFALVLLALSAAAFAQIGISISFAPPELPVYEQPLCPGEGYLWTPGYWAYANDFDDYYWVPGTWVMAPEVGYLWTPAYWGWGGNGYLFYEGYWGPQVGFYGGINYGYGYFGDGYQGGRWQGGQFYYNRSVNNVNITNIHNVYNTTVINNTENRVSYNGGNGGINRRPTPQEEAAVHEKHIPPVAVQTQHVQAAHAKPELRATANHGTPPVAATPKPGALNDRAVVPAKQAGTPYNPPANRAAVQPAVNTPAAHTENKTAQPDRPTANTQTESNRVEPNRSPAMQPNKLPEPPVPNRPPTAQPNHQPEPNRPEPEQHPQTPPPTERLQPQHTPPPVETQHAPQERQHPQPEVRTPDEKKPQDEPPKREEKTPQQ
jgi:WXXGXW repeat (2 copies)